MSFLNVSQSLLFLVFSSSIQEKECDKTEQEVSLSSLLVLISNSVASSSSQKRSSKGRGSEGVVEQRDAHLQV